MLYTIKEASEQLGLTAHTIRHYTDNGLVPGLQRDRNGNRLFDEKALNWLKCAHLLRNSGLSVSEVRHYFELCCQGIDTFEERFSILQDLKKRSEAELEYAHYRLNCITEKLAHCEDIRAGKCEDDCNPLNW